MSLSVLCCKIREGEVFMLHVLEGQYVIHIDEKSYLVMRKGNEFNV